MSGAVPLIIAYLLGGGSLFVAFLWLLIYKPETLQIWLAWLLSGIKRIWKGAENAWLANLVAGNVNKFLGSVLDEQLGGLAEPNVAIKWTNSAEAVASEREGTVIVRMRPEESKERNIMRATLAAAPRIVAPTVRPHLTEEHSDAIDLQLCRRLARRLGETARSQFVLDILDPAVSREPALQPILEEFEAVDRGGWFVPVLLRELIKVGTEHWGRPLPDLDNEARSFSQFLLTIATRDREEEVPLTFIGRYFRVEILLVAMPWGRRAGVRVYRGRVGRELGKGVTTVYVAATERNLDFAHDVADALEADRRLLRRPSSLMWIERDGEGTRGYLVPFELNTGYEPAEHFRDVVDALNIAVGQEATVVVTDVQDDYVLVDVGGVQGSIRASDLTWEYVDTCSRAVEIGQEIDAQISEIDYDSLEVRLDRTACLPNPLNNHRDDELVDTECRLIVRAIGTTNRGRQFAVGELDKFEGVPCRLYESEIAWGVEEGTLSDLQSGNEVPVLIYEVDHQANCCLGSRKRLLANQWDEIRQRYPEGRELEVVARQVVEGGVYCTVEPGLAGFIPHREFDIAGLEYGDFRDNVRSGQTFYVYVRRVVAGTRQRLTLGLQQNRDG